MLIDKYVAIATENQPRNLATLRHATKCNQSLFIQFNNSQNSNISFPIFIVDAHLTGVSAPKLLFSVQYWIFQSYIENFYQMLTISTDPSNDRQWLNDFKSRICLTHTKMLLHGGSGGGKREESDAGKIFFGVKYFCGFTKLHSLLSAIKRCETITFRFRYIARHCISDSFCDG